jgi:hypothetical protein
MESVLVTLFCCLLTGVIAIVYSHEVGGWGWRTQPLPQLELTVPLLPATGWNWEIWALLFGEPLGPPTTQDLVWKGLLKQFTVKV